MEKKKERGTGGTGSSCGQCGSDWQVWRKDINDTETLMCSKCISSLYEGDDGDDDENEEEEDEEPSDAGTEEVDEEEWEEIYNEEEDDEGIRFLTFGGGPSGGYEVSKVARGDDGLYMLWSWRQNWGTEREYILLEASRLLFKEEHYTGRTIKYCRLVRAGIMGGAQGIQSK